MVNTNSPKIKRMNFFEEHLFILLHQRLQFSEDCKSFLHSRILGYNLNIDFSMFSFLYLQDWHGF